MRIPTFLSLGTKCRLEGWGSTHKCYLVTPIEWYIFLKVSTKAEDSHKLYVSTSALYERAASLGYLFFKFNKFISQMEIQKSWMLRLRLQLKLFY